MKNILNIRSTKAEALTVIEKLNKSRVDEYEYMKKKERNYYNPIHLTK